MKKELFIGKIMKCFFLKKNLFTFCYFYPYPTTPLFSKTDTYPTYPNSIPPPGRRKVDPPPMVWLLAHVWPQVPSKHKMLGTEERFFDTPVFSRATEQIACRDRFVHTCRVQYLNCATAIWLEPGHYLTVCTHIYAYYPPRRIGKQRFFWSFF